MVGRTIEHYEILARVGGGGMGVVYRARDTRLGRTVALKFLPPQWSQDESARQRFFREAQAASATNHPNICTIHDIESAPDGQLFIVMSFYEGPTLKQRLESAVPLPVDEALDIATQIADGLARAHAQGVIHRDVKPGNIILTEDGVRILDFGLATFADAVKLTLEHSPIGTFAYMSPEQVRAQSADARSDVWAIGVMLYEMLAGRPPFQGSHAEAIAYAIRHETPPPLRNTRPGIPEAVEQLVFRAMHKEPSVRFQSGRELARALRQVRGQSMPPDLRTEPISIEARHAHPEVSRRSRWVAATAVALTLAAVTWILWPIERVLIAVVPVVNQTGYAEVGPLRPGLTHALSVALSSSDSVRVVGHDEVSAILAGVQSRGDDISSGEALRAISDTTAARVLVVVTLLNQTDRSGFRAHVEFRRSDTLTSDGPGFETPATASALVKETAYRLMPVVAAGIAGHFRAAGPLRGELAHLVRTAIGRPSAFTLPAATPDAAALFERGVHAYQDVEYVTALGSLAKAAEYEPLNPLLAAWRSRVARALRLDVDAERLAREAVGLLSEDTPVADRLFVEAVSAESRRDADTALERYTSLTRRSRDDPTALIELAGYLDRQGSSADAIAAYHQALALAPQLLRPHLELCRLYNRISESVRAREHGRRAVDSYGAIGAGARLAQALFCLTDSLRVGDDNERRAAVGHATTALEIVEGLQAPYNLPRAYNYLALAEEAQGRLAEAARWWERALEAARDGSNLVIQPLVLMNLGATSEKLGDRVKAVEYLRQSAAGFEKMGDQARAAENLFNVGAILVGYGGDAQEGVRNISDAVEVFRTLGNRSFEVRAAHVMSTHYRLTGQYEEAERELNRALSLAGERDLDFGSVITSIRLAQTHIDTGKYSEARRLLTDVLPKAAARTALEARLHLARAHMRLGDRESAAQHIDAVRTALEGSSDTGLRPLLHAVTGEVAEEAGERDAARDAFARASSMLTRELPDIDALEARAQLGWLEAGRGRGGLARGQALLREALDLARAIGHRSLEARCRVLLARIDFDGGRFEQALKELAEVPPDEGGRAIERELRASVHHWSGRARAARGDLGGAASDDAAATTVVTELEAGLPEDDRSAFRARPVIARILSR